jgi:lipopolysaccharide transport system ATP-binding protein
MVYDIMMVLKSKEGIPFATYARGHYMGEIQHTPKGHFSIRKKVKLPKILTKGVINVDLSIHHPMVEYYFKAPGCCVLECEGFQKGFGRTMNQDGCGFIGLEDSISSVK